MEAGYLGPLLVGSLALVGAIGGYFTYKAKVDELNRRLAEKGAQIEDGEKRVSAAVTLINALELRIEREFVKKMDLAEVEARLGKRIEGAVHDLKGAFSNVVAALQVRPRSNPRGGE